MIKTVLYLTDNSIDENLLLFCQERLKKECFDIPIISVSQKPINFGKNICVGNIGRSWMSLYKQILAGLELCETDYIGIAEHDCLYNAAHIKYIPTSDNIFFYNHNCWLVDSMTGIYSYWPHRFALSQLVCHRDLLKKSTIEIMNLLMMGLKVSKGMKWYGEPGLVSDTYKVFVEADSGRSSQLQRYLKKYVSEYKSKSFKTEKPNIDIRHGKNFTGPKRGKKRCYELPYWGNFLKLYNEAL